jgi:Flp pilus assembly protein TadB
LPEAADFFARALCAGHSFANVMQMVGEEMPEPIAGEFKFAYEEINYGVPMNEACTPGAAGAADGLALSGHRCADPA